MAKAKLTLILSGMIAGDPYQGGATWAVLQYMLGFQRLGHDICLVEPVKETSLVTPDLTFARSANAAYFSQVVRDFGLEDRAALLLAGSRETVGVPYDELGRFARRADVLINVSGLLADADL